MKAFLLSGLLLVFVATPAFAQTPTPVGQIKGLYDDLEYSDTATYSASVSATPRPVTRTTTTSTANTPVSGAVENTIALLVGGLVFILLGTRLSKQNA